MKWRREVNYHGSRSYGSEEPPLKLSSVMIAWLAEIIKTKLRKRRPPPRPAALMLNDQGRKFSMLGTDSRAVPADCPFPVRAHIRKSDRRVLP